MYYMPLLYRHNDIYVESYYTDSKGLNIIPLDYMLDYMVFILMTYYTPRIVYV